MDTIIYIYRKKGLREPIIEPIGLKSYMLIRVALDVREDEWFGLRLGLPEALAEGKPKAGKAGPEAVVVPAGKEKPEAVVGQTGEEEPEATAGKRGKVGPEATAGQRKKEEPEATTGQRRKVAPEAAEEQRRKEGPEATTRQKTEIAVGWSRVLHPIKSMRLHRMRCRNRRLEERRIRSERQEKERFLAEWRERIQQADMVIERLAEEILELAEDRRSCRVVYEGAVRNALAGAQKSGRAAVPGSLAPEQDGLGMQDRAALRAEPEMWDRPALQDRLVPQGRSALYAESVFRREQDNGREPWQEQSSWEGRGILRGQVLWELWKRHFDMEEFRDYTQRFWADRLLPYARLCDYVILGTAPCIYEIIEEQARGMKSLRWMLLKEDCDQELWEFVEDFYTEYGLAIELRTFDNREAFRKVRPLCSRPSNIIDFTGAVWPSMTEAAAGSVWLDMFSSDEKRYRLQGRRTEVEYVSLKEEWKRAKRRCSAPEWGGTEC